MSKPPAFQFYASDFLASTVAMTAEEVGAYIRLLCYQWDNGSIPDDQERAARIAGCGGNAVASIWHKFGISQNGGLANARMEAVRSESMSYRQKQAENAQKRWEKVKNTCDGNATAYAMGMPPHMPPHMPNACPPSPSPSPSPIPSSTPSSKNADKSAASEAGLAFADWFFTLLPEGTNPSSGYRQAWAHCYDDMIRLDGRTGDHIRAVCQWARLDSFWSSNFLTPLKLRKRKDGAQYFDVFVQRMASPRLNGTAAEVQAAKRQGEPQQEIRVKVWNPMEDDDD